MTSTTRNARITGAVTYQSAEGDMRHIPLGPCLLQRHDHQSVDIVWGLHGQKSTALPVETVQSARQQGNLLLL
jgi:hypothetical protein